MLTDGSIDLLRAFLNGLDIFGIAPLGWGARIEEDGMAESDTLDAAFKALTAGLSEDQVRKLRSIMLAHVTFLMGALEYSAADEPVTEGQ